MDLGIAGKRAVVCASSKGLGLGCAEALAEAGVHLVMNARGVEALEASAEALRAAYAVEVRTVAADVTTADGQAALIEAAGDADILVNNAGGPPPGMWHDWDRDDFIKARCCGRQRHHAGRGAGRACRHHSGGPLWHAGRVRRGLCVPVLAACGVHCGPEPVARWWRDRGDDLGGRDCAGRRGHWQGECDCVGRHTRWQGLL